MRKILLICVLSTVSVWPALASVGDTFTAVLAVRLAEGESLRGACAAANAAAAKSVERKYVLPSLPLRGEMAV